MIIKDDEERQRISSPPPSHHHFRRKPHHLMETLSTHRIYALALLLILSFVLGYLSHQSTSSCPRISESTATTTDSDNPHNQFNTGCAAPVDSTLVRQTIINKVYNGTSPWESFPPEHAKPRLMKHFSKGWGSQGAVFEHLLRQVRPRTVVEVGTYLGASATHMAALARKLGLETQILCIDDFRGWPGHADDGTAMAMVNGDTMLLYQFMQNVVSANATDSLMFLPFSTTTAMNALCKWGVYGDLVEIDADHDFHSAWVDINNGYKVVKKPDGVLFGHDYAWDGVRKAVHIFADQHGLRVRRDGEHWILY